MKNKMSICFLDPEGIGENRYFDENNGIEPVGMMSVVENIKHRNRDVKVVQQLTKTNNEVISRILETNPKILAVTSYSYNFENSLEIVKAVKKEIEDLIVVYGGMHVSYCPEESLKNELIDFVVIKEGELTLNELFVFLEKGNINYSEINGLAYRSFDGKIIINPERERINDLGNIKYPKRNELNMDYKKESLIHLPVSQIRNAGMETARGCGFNCEFCTSKFFWEGGNIPNSNCDYVVEQMEHLNSKFGTNFILFTDERFIIKGRERDQILLDKMIEKRIGDKINYSCFNTLRDVDQKTLFKLRKSGCSYINYGVEAIDLSVLKNMRKHHNKIDKAREVFEMTREADIFGAALFMIGSPYETVQNIDKLENYVVENSDVIDKIRISFYTPFPGTDSFKSAKKESIFHTKNIMDDGSISYNHFSTKQVVITPEGLSKELGLDKLSKEERDLKVEEYLKTRRNEIIRKFYTSEKYFLGCIYRIKKNTKLVGVYKDWFKVQNKRISGYYSYIPQELIDLLGDDYEK